MNHAVSIKAVLCSVVLFSTVVNAQNNSNNLNIDTLKQARNEQTLSLTQALNYALTHEPWLKASGYQEDATIAQSIAAVRVILVPEVGAAWVVCATVGVASNP